MDLIAADAKYHPLCRFTYISKGRTQVYEHRPEEKDAYKSAFQSLMKIYEKDIRAGKAFETSTLLASYRSLLEGKVQNASNYQAEKLKPRLSKFYGNAIIFQPQSGKNKPELVYCASVSLKDAINALSEMKQRKSESIFIAQKKSSSEVHERPQEGVLLNAAQILASALREVKGIQTSPVTAADISAAKAEEVVPDVLYMFLRSIFYEGAEKDANPIRMHSDKERLHRRILSVAQDMIFIYSNGSKDTPKHVEMAISFRHLTESRTAISMLNRFGHLSSYGKTERIYTAIAESIIAKAEEDGVVLPMNIRPGVFVQAGGDNLDFCEETLDRKQTPQRNGN